MPSRADNEKPTSPAASDATGEFLPEDLPPPARKTPAAAEATGEFLPPDLVPPAPRKAGAASDMTGEFDPQDTALAERIGQTNFPRAPKKAPPAASDATGEFLPPDRDDPGQTAL